MDIHLVPGTYVVATSGGVDSMLLLDLLRQLPDLKLIVAHYDHGIRDDSAKDRKLVQDVSRQHGLPFIYDVGNLGGDASEDKARKARYEFLHRVRSASGARAIVTAHHKDDLAETAVMHMIRGTGRRGLSSLTSNPIIKRPLLGVSKADIIDHAKSRELVWHEDSTNQDPKYLRNYIRHNIITKLTDQQRQQLHEVLIRSRKLNKEIDEILDTVLHVQPSRTSLSRSWFARLPHAVSLEVMAHWLRRHGIRDFSRRQLERLVIDAKTLIPGQSLDVQKMSVLKITPNLLALESSDR